MRLMRKLHPVFGNDDKKGGKYRDSMWLMWLTRVSYDKFTGKWTGMF